MLSTSFKRPRQMPAWPKWMLNPTRIPVPKPGDRSEERAAGLHCFSDPTARCDVNRVSHKITLKTCTVAPNMKMECTKSSLRIRICRSGTRSAGGTPRCGKHQKMIKSPAPAQKVVNGQPLNSSALAAPFDSFENSAAPDCTVVN